MERSEPPVASVAPVGKTPAARSSLARQDGLDRERLAARSTRTTRTGRRWRPGRHAEANATPNTPRLWPPSRATCFRVAVSQTAAKSSSPFAEELHPAARRLPSGEKARPSRGACRPRVDGRAGRWPGRAVPRAVLSDHGEPFSRRANNRRVREPGAAHGEQVLPGREFDASAAPPAGKRQPAAVGEKETEATPARVGAATGLAGGGVRRVRRRPGRDRAAPAGSERASRPARTRPGWKASPLAKRRAGVGASSLASSTCWANDGTSGGPTRATRRSSRRGAVGCSSCRSPSICPVRCFDLSRRAARGDVTARGVCQAFQPDVRLLPLPILYPDTGASRLLSFIPTRIVGG